MKDKKNNSIQFLSEEIVRLEKELLENKNVEANKKKITNIMSSLSMDEVLQIDDYITTNKLL